MSPTVIRTEKSYREVRWAIVVPSYLYLNFTFHEFILPMPYGKCDDVGSIERVRMKKDKFGMNYKEEDLHFCGRRKAFFLILTSNDVLVSYSCINPGMCSGHFLLQYQVCDPMKCGGKAVRTIHLLESLYLPEYYTTFMS